MTDCRGMTAGFSIADLRDKIQQTPYTKLWARLERRTREVMADAREGGFTTLGYGSLAWYSFTPMAREAAMLWRLTANEDALRYVEQCIEVVDRANRHPERYEGLLGAKPPVNSHGETALAADICRDGLSERSREQLLALARDHLIDYHQGDAPYIGYAGGGNVAYCQTINAACCALTWGEDCGHPGWEEVIHHAVEYTRCYLKYGCDAGGFGYEGTGYSHEVFHFIFLFAQLLVQNGMTDLFAEEPRMRTLVEGTLQLAFPGGQFLANINDHGLLMPRSMGWLLYTAKHYDDPLHLGLWYAYQGPDHPIRPYGDVMPWYREHHLPGPMPIDENVGMLQALLHWDADAPFTSITEADRPKVVYSPGTETAVMRTSWSDDAVAIHLAGAGRSHASQTHRHADCGHFSVWAYGEYLAVDTGRYNADEDQHNVVLVDGKAHLPNDGWGMSHRSGRKFGFRSSELCTHICADASHMKDCNWADRHFLFVPLGDDDCYLVVIDNINKDNSCHSFVWQLHAGPECAFSIESGSSAVLRGERARLDVQFVIPGAEDFPDTPHQLSLSTDEAEWSWPYGRKESDPLEGTGLTITSVKRQRLLADLQGANCQLMAVIVPRRLDAPALTVRPFQELRLLQVEIEHALGTDLVVAALDHGYIRTPQVQALTHLALVRRSPNGELIATWSVDGAAVKAGPRPTQ